MKKLLSIILTILMLVTMIPFTPVAFAADDGMLLYVDISNAISDGKEVDGIWISAFKAVSNDVVVNNQVMDHVEDNIYSSEIPSDAHVAAFSVFFTDETSVSWNFSVDWTGNNLYIPTGNFEGQWKKYGVCDHESITNGLCNSCGRFVLTEGHTHALEIGGEGYEFTEFPVDTRMINTAGNYYLTQDIELTDYLWINVEGTVNLCLNGHSITAVEKNSNQTVVFLYRGTLNLCDCQGGGCITSTEASNASGLRALSGAEFNMYSGEIKDNYYYAVSGGEFNMYGGKLSGNKRAAVYVIDTFNMYGGEISDNSNEYGAVYVDGGDFTMYDGEIKNNINTSTVWNRGTVFVDSGAFTMKGGKITGNTSEKSCGGVCSYENFVMEGGEISNNSGYSGGVVVVSDKFIMNGGKISGNTANYGGGVWLNQNSSFIMNGGEISENSAEQGGGVYSDYDSAKIELKKGVITGNKAVYCAGGVGSDAFRTPVEISGADVQIMNNSAYYFHDLVVENNPLIISAPLDSEKTKIYVDTFAGRIVARPDGTNLTTLKGMEDCFISNDEKLLLRCNANGELESLYWYASIDETDGDLVVKTPVIDNVTYQWYEVNGEELTKLDGETSAKITCDKLVVGKTYACRIYLAGGEIETLTIEYNYAITHQPTAGEPYVELNDDTDATYQWYTLESGAEEITDQNASGDWQSKGAPFGNSVYEDGKWVADTFNNLQYYFMIELEAGQTINIEFASEVENIIFSIFDTAAPPDFTEINDSQYSITVEESGVYWLVVYGTPVDYARATLGGFKYIPIEGETSAELQNLTFGNNYACKATCGDGKTVLTSDFFEYAYLITHQPTAVEPYVELNDDTDASYQWYKIEGDGEEITDKNASGDWQSLGAPFGNTVYEDGKWIADNWSGQQYYFMVDLEAGETINLEFASDVETIVFGIDGEPTGGVTEVGTSELSITVEESGTYWLVVLGTSVDYVCATIGNIEYTPIEGATSAEFNPAELGKYACEVTFADNTTEMSDVFSVTTLHTCDFTGEWKYDSEKHWKECTCGEIDGEAEHTFTDGKCDCGYECPHEDTYNNLIRPVQNADATWGKGKIVEICNICGNSSLVQEVERDHEGYKVFDETALELEAILNSGKMTDKWKNDYTNILNGLRNSAYYQVYTEIETAIPSMTESLKSIIAEIEAGLADGTMIKADFTYMTSLFDEINALIDNDPNKLIPSESGRFQGIYYGYYMSCKNNGNHSQADYDQNMAGNNWEGQIEAILAGVKDGTMLKADYTEIDEAITALDEKLADVNLTDEAKTELEEIKSQLEEMKADGNTSAADLAELEKALEDYETELDAGIEDGSALKADYTAIDEAIAEIEEKLADENVTDEAKAELEEIKSQLEEKKADGNTSKADLAELEKALEDYEEELDKGIEDGTLVEVDGIEILLEYQEEMRSALIEKYGYSAYEEIVNSKTDEVEAETIAIEEAAKALTGTVAENAEKIAEIKAKFKALFDKAELCLAGTHSYIYEEISPAKCGKNAVEEGTCWFCGETVTRDVENSALTHSFTKYEEVEEPKCGIEGKEVATCDHGCGATDEKAIEALEHLFIDYIYNEDATCTADGTKTAECVYGCGETDTVTAEDTMLDHADEDGDKICDDCETEIKDVCPDCGGPAHEETGVPQYICMLITLIKLVVALVKALQSVA